MCIRDRLGTGLRIGEALGLTWSDCDFQNNLIRVTHALLYLSLIHIWKYGLKQIDSYTTRPPRYLGEGGHTFVKMCIRDSPYTGAKVMLFASRAIQ